jgi:hypothetical protein
MIEGGCAFSHPPFLIKQYFQLPPYFQGGYGMNQTIVIQNIGSTSEWRRIFQFVLSYCSRFSVSFPVGDYDAENPLMGGKKTFELLDELEVTLSELEESLVLRGKLTKDSAALFEEYMAPSYVGFKPVLWNFQLLKDNIPILEVSDFTVCILSKSAPIEHFLDRANIDVSSLEN